jgi:hypothetical protein
MIRWLLEAAFHCLTVSHDPGSEMALLMRIA